MITEREVKILADAIKKQSGLDIPPDAALAALYAVANYNYRRIPQKPEPHKYRNVVYGDSVGPESEPKSSAPAKLPGN